MTQVATAPYEFDVEKVEYLRHGDMPLYAELYRPRGKGPFPLMIEVHGGAWCHATFQKKTIHKALAGNGVVVAALDFRMPPTAGYPASLSDVNYGVRWFKSFATNFGSRADVVGITGSSSGGHQAMLSAMRPHDFRYSSLPLRGQSGMDATVRCAVLCWPVIDPLGRYQYAKKVEAEGNSKGAYWVKCHDQYWQGEAAMAEGSPALALERHERVELPPVLYVQGVDDFAHPRSCLDRFVPSYRKAGGRLELELYEGEGEAFITLNPNSPAVPDALGKIIDFVHREMPVD
jgi:acetyl esterase